jgi:hypothetical protein
MYAKFFSTESEARSACQAWVERTRGDWYISDIQEVLRNKQDLEIFGPWMSRDCVAPAYRHEIPNVPVRRLYVRASGDFSRYSEDYGGTSSSSFTAVFPA